MSVTFIEYQILPEHRSAYSEWMKQVRAAFPELEVYEGTDQPGLFVELWKGQSHEEYKQLKEARLNLHLESEEASQENGGFGKMDWKPLHNWATGGRGKIHIWHFGKVR
jgi:hypothetical protein